MKTAVTSVFTGKERVFNRRFLIMTDHYGVEPVACSPAAGWEKGQVENQVQTGRERLFKSFRYLYDFGDAWEHNVRIEGIVPADLQASYPRLIEATGTRPPEDSGGPWGYAEKLEALADPTHEYHDDALEALGDDHDPHAQPDLDLIHTRFAALAKKWTPRQRKTK